MLRLGNDQIHITVNPSVHIEIAQQRHNIQLQRIVHPHHDFIFLPVFHPVGNIHRKSRIASPVFRRMLTVDKNIGYGVYSFKTQKKPFPLPIGGNFQCFLIIRKSPEIIGFSSQSIRIPRMGRVTSE